MVKTKADKHMSPSGLGSVKVMGIGNSDGTILAKARIGFMTLLLAGASGLAKFRSAKGAFL
ncbi:MAG: hypothetical protein C5B53_11095 [Candidatus Melainabacteria bacterium]|nr:MAG: hypothetical protein C5B53_11095 [Candidatus Melainabacteria bacterium]